MKTHRAGPGPIVESASICLTALLIALIAPTANAAPPTVEKLDRIAREMSKITGRYGPWRVTRGHTCVAVAKPSIFWSKESLQRAIRQPDADGQGGHVGQRVQGKVEIFRSTEVPRRGLGKLIGKVTGRATKTTWRSISSTELVARAIEGKPAQVRGMQRVQTYQMPNRDHFGRYTTAEREAVPTETIKSATGLINWWNAHGETLTGK